MVVFKIVVSSCDYGCFFMFMFLIDCLFVFVFVGEYVECSCS